ncbi:hypothetical protein ABPG77_000516 [Micractinium sp. CCAP 211/92]
MPPKKKRPLVWMPLTWRALLPAGEVREYYLPLSKEEIDSDLQHLSSLLVTAQGKRRATGMRLAAPGGAVQPMSSDEYSPSSQQGEDENESVNPSDQQLHAAAAAAQWAGQKGAGVPGISAMQQPHHQQQVGMV